MKTVQLLLLVGVAIGTNSYVRGSEIDELKAILETIGRRHDSYNPIRFKSHIQMKRTKYFYASTSKIDPDDKRSWAKLQDTNSLNRGEFARKGNMSLQQSNGPFFSNYGKLINPKQVWIYAYDGKLLKSTDGSGKGFNISRRQPNFNDPLANHNGERSLLGLRKQIQGGKLPPLKSLKISRETAPVKNAALRVTILSDKEDTWDFWVTAEDQGCCVLRFEGRGRGGNLFHEYSDCRYEMVDGVYVLKSALNRFYYHHENIHQLTEEIKFEVDSITLNAKDIPDDLFQLPIPAGAEIIDEDMNNQRVTDPAEVEKHIQAAVAAVERRDQPGWWKWLYLGLSVLFLLGFLYLMSKFFKARSAQKIPTSP